MLINGAERQIGPGATLHGANLRGANLYGANLYGADLHGANLYGANLRGAQNIPAHVDAMTRIVRDGDLTVYKRCYEGVVTLRIPEAAKRSNATGRKCRAEYAIVVETPDHAPAHSLHDAAFVYAEGATVRPSAWCDERWQECAEGIHFFLTRREAEEYYL